MEEFFSLAANILKDPAKMWVAIALILLFIEFFIISEMGVFFLSLGALSTAIALHFHLLNLPTHEAQSMAAIGFTFGWAMLLWGRVRVKGDTAYISLIGVKAKVHKNPLIKGKIGKIDVSGTKMLARLSPRIDLDKIEAGQEVWIHDVDNKKVFLVGPTPSIINLRR